jgi:hypothetical protein
VFMKPEFRLGAVKEVKDVNFIHRWAVDIQ